MVAVKVTIHRDLVSKSSLEETNLGILLRCRKINLVTVNKLQLCSQKNKGVMWTLPTESSFSCDHLISYACSSLAKPEYSLPISVIRIFWRSICCWKPWNDHHLISWLIFFCFWRKILLVMMTRQTTILNLYRHSIVFIIQLNKKEEIKDLRPWAWNRSQPYKHMDGVC